jgi:DNA-binding XRE family transcriptional regulator
LLQIFKDLVRVFNPWGYQTGIFENNFKSSEAKDMSRDDLGTEVGTSGAIIGRYERGEMIPSVEMAKKIA